MTANQINWFNAKEQQRHNLATEGISKYTVKETKRHNQASEGLTHESNLIQEWLNVQTAKHYARMDAENHRHNVVYEAETNRHNTSLENIESGKAGLEYTNKQWELQIREKEAANEEKKADAAALNAWVNFISYAPDSKYKSSSADKNRAETALTKERTITEATERIRKDTESGLNVAKTISEIFKGASQFVKLIEVFE